LLDKGIGVPQTLPVLRSLRLYRAHPPATVSPYIMDGQAFFQRTKRINNQRDDDLTAFN
jgi:hypothetical protein